MSQFNPITGLFERTTLRSPALGPGLSAFDNPASFLWRRPSTGAPEFTPASISGLVLWVDPSDAATLTFGIGSRVAQMNDKSGNANHAFMATALEQPVLATAVQDGKNMLRLENDATHPSWMQLTNPIDVTNGFTAFFVAKKPSGDNRAFLYGPAPSSYPTNYPWLFYGTDNTGPYVEIDGKDKGNYTDYLTDDGAAHAIWGYTSATDAKCGRDAEISTPDFQYDNGGTGTWIIDQLFRGGADANTIDHSVGWVGPLLIYARPLTEGEITQVRDYLKLKWDLP